MTDEMGWFIVRAHSEREEKIKEALEARIRAAGIEDLFGRIMVPTEHLSEIRGGKKRIVKQRMYPGYILIEMKICDESWFLVTETPGISGFVAPDRRHPVAMREEEVQRILQEVEDKKEKPRPKVEFELGETVKIKEGPFENYDGVVEDVTPSKGLVRVGISIFGRSTSVELEFAKVERI